MNKNALGSLLLRLGLGGVFLWFGIDKFFDPNIWVGYIPSWFAIPFSKITFIYLLGVFETLVGFGVFAGLFTRFSSLLAAVSLVPIMIFLGYNEIMIRDLGLFFLALGIALLGAGEWSLDAKILKRKE